MKKIISILIISLSLLLNHTIFSNPLSLPAPIIYSQHCDTLFWSRVQTATYYKIQMSTDLYFQNVILDSNHISDTMFVLPNGFGNLQAYYHVRAFNSTDTSNWSLTQILSSFLPPPPVVIGVIDTTADTLTIAWRRVPNAISYRLQVSFYQNFTSFLINTVLVDTCWHILSGTLIGDMIYYYRISSINSCGQGIWSPVYHFTVNFLTTCRLPCNIICINDTTSTTPCFFWHRTVYNLYYRVKISTDSLFLNTVYNSGFTPDTFKCMSGPSLNYEYCYYLNLLAQDSTGYTYFSGNYRFHLTQTIGVSPSLKNIPDHYSLYQNYPNPFNPVTKIKFDIPAQNSPLIKGEERSGGGCQVSLIIYDLIGREVATLVNEQLQPGTFEIEWDASNFASGIYFYKLVAGDFVETKKMVLMK